MNFLQLKAWPHSNLFFFWLSSILIDSEFLYLKNVKNFLINCHLKNEADELLEYYILCSISWLSNIRNLLTVRKLDSFGTFWTVGVDLCIRWYDIRKDKWMTSPAYLNKVQWLSIVILSWPIGNTHNIYTLRRKHVYDTTHKPEYNKAHGQCLLWKLV